MVSGNDHHRNSLFGEFEQSVIRKIDDFPGKLASEEKVSAVNKQINFCPGRPIENAMEIGIEILPPASPRYPGPYRVIESQMGVCEESNANFLLICHYQSMLTSKCRVVTSIFG